MGLKQWVNSAYTFTPGASGVGTVNLSGIASFDIKLLVAIVNLTENIPIYTPGTNTGKGYTSVAGNIVTLEFDTTGMNAADELAVVYAPNSSGGGLTDTELRASPVPVSLTSTTVTGSVAVTNAALSVVGGGTESAAMRVTLANDSTGVLSVDDNGGSLTVDGTVAISGSVAVTGSLTDAQLRATPVPVSGTVSTGGLTDAELRAAAVPVSAASLPLPSGASTSALQTTGNTSLSSIDGKVPANLTVTATRLLVDPSGVTSPISAASLPLPTGAATAALQTQPGVDIGDVTINNASGASAVNIQDGGNSITVDGTVAVSGSVAVTGPLTDTQLRASAVPVSLTSTTITGTVAATQSGTWTVQPGNTANTTAWKVDGSAVTQPVSGTITANAGSGTFTTQDTSSLVDNSAFTDGTSRVVTGGYIFDDVAGTALAENDVAAARIDSKRAQSMVIEDAATRGRNATVKAAATPAVTATDTALVVTPLRHVRATYRAATTTNVVAAAGAAMFFVITGSGTKTIKVKKIGFGGATLTAVAYNSVVVEKWSTAPTGGTATTLTQVPLDSNFAAGTATLCQVYTAAPTEGTLVGTIAAARDLFQATTAAAAGIPVTREFEFGKEESEQVVLRGSAQGVSLAFGAAPATAVTLAVWVEWTEE
jgi:hypothetical protein